MTEEMIRVGIGFDAHKFSKDSARELWIACLKWDGETGLEANSDGDVVTHAIADALLSATNLPDIGNFLLPAQDYKNTHGEHILHKVSVALLEVRAKIVNVSAQLIGNSPKFSPMKSEAQDAVSGALVGNPPVSLSATTTDSLGFTGEGKGLACIATALILLPEKV
ncbi:MAG: 2-C-methyl-D-erythritol 2,4-cyclodiphosphate synthase [Bifidobacteriaceae bacterium]|jgi:2-C-methyl-D-erythritol 2,4-cyclodiphosphate synthase|nr:2-C-methyl-D-erythritol 2,4-cyclodiphosphate synthase [Bifidobacteriaceae bacterium]